MKKYIYLIFLAAFFTIEAGAQTKNFKLGQWTEIHNSILMELNRSYVDSLPVDRIRPRWEEYLVLTMGRCTDYFEKLPLVQDKTLLDNILYSGVWVNKRRKGQKENRDV